MQKQIIFYGSILLVGATLIGGCNQIFKDSRASNPNCQSFTNWKGEKAYSCVEPTTEPVETASAGATEQAQQWLNSANQEPTWSGQQFEENQRKAWAK
jgi:hypothetical protein